MSTHWRPPKSTPGTRAEAGTFDRLADNLGALSFMIDMLSVQPQMAQSLFRFDPDTGNLTAVMGRRSHRLSGFGGFDELATSAPTPLVDQAQSLAQARGHARRAGRSGCKQGLQRLSQQALLADQRGLAETMVSAQVALQRATDDVQREKARADLAQAVAGLAEPQHREVSVQQPVRETPAPQPEVMGSTGLEDDAEMREIFIDEAREVLQGAREALARLGDAPDDLGDLTLIRRAFHTLKGSSRMVGLKDFGDAAWACEQLYNARLALSAHLESDVETFTAEALGELEEWVEAIATGHHGSHAAAALGPRADALRMGNALPEPALPALSSAEQQAHASAALLERVPQLPSARRPAVRFRSGAGRALARDAGTRGQRAGRVRSRPGAAVAAADIRCVDSGQATRARLARPWPRRRGRPGAVADPRRARGREGRGNRRAVGGSISTMPSLRPSSAPRRNCRAPTPRR